MLNYDIAVLQKTCQAFGSKNILKVKKCFQESHKKCTSSDYQIFLSILLSTMFTINHDMNKPGATQNFKFLDRLFKVKLSNYS